MNQSYPVAIAVAGYGLGFFILLVLAVMKYQVDQAKKKRGLKK